MEISHTPLFCIESGYPRLLPDLLLFLPLHQDKEYLSYLYHETRPDRELRGVSPPRNDLHQPNTLCGTGVIRIAIRFSQYLVTFRAKRIKTLQFIDLNQLKWSSLQLP
ncbi:MAG: hypothetical protein JAY97_01375 [Candidatus Thiodiazotropha sp. 'RUGA']|nr:hypothetical protein [Candidatus Thiodiazotropha sp. 'RUGA']